MVPMGHARARGSNTGDDRGNLGTQLKNLAQFGPSDECIVNGGGKVGHWGDGMVDHQPGGSWLGRESWRQNQRL